ncbi:MAG: preQ(1) synthase [Pseudomonadota bacterium]|nr:preQ(1) synthase [Pseudomonadota bacterium]
MVNIKKTRFLGKKNITESSPDKFILDYVNNPHPEKDYSIRFSSSELTSVCPITSQPDFGYIVVDYIPNKVILESKSFKLFLFSFRNYGGFHEDCTIKIAKKIIRFVKPKWIRVACFWNPRGGIPIDIFYQSGEKPKKIYIEDLTPPYHRGR